MSTRPYIEAAALQLEAEDRVRLVDVLVTSLAVEQAMDDAWFTDLEERVDAVRTESRRLLAAHPGTDPLSDADAPADGHDDGPLIFGRGL